jgi:deoxyadenosine/deoxycytidine kinase
MPFLALAGNIGSGKSNLTKVLAARLNYEPFFEPVEDNPYLADFYQDMKVWAFHSQIFYLVKSLQYNQTLKNHNRPVIQDRSFYENAEIFARNLYNDKILTERDWQTYREFYETHLTGLRHPDLIIYLKAKPETLMLRIAKRNRESEKPISIQYIMRLNELYDDWIENFKLCPTLTIPIEGTDFRERPEEQNWLIEKIRRTIN